MIFIHTPPSVLNCDLTQSRIHVSVSFDLEILNFSRVFFISFSLFSHFWLSIKTESTPLWGLSGAAEAVLLLTLRALHNVRHNCTLYIFTAEICLRGCVVGRESEVGWE